MEAELVAARERLNTAQEEIGRVGEPVEVIEDLQDKVERLEWERDEADKGHEVSLLLARENIRKKLTQTHQELETRDYLIQLLKERVAKLQEAGSRQEAVTGLTLLPHLRTRVHDAHTVTLRQGCCAPVSLCMEVPMHHCLQLPVGLLRCYTVSIQW